MIVISTSLPWYSTNNIYWRQLDFRLIKIRTEIFCETNFVEIIWNPHWNNFVKGISILFMCSINFEEMQVKYFVVFFLCAPLISKRCKWNKKKSYAFLHKSVYSSDDLCDCDVRRGRDRRRIYRPSRPLFLNSYRLRNNDSHTPWGSMVFKKISSRRLNLCQVRHRKQYYPTLIVYIPGN